MRAVQLAYGINIPSKYRSLIKDSVRSASTAVTSIVMSEEEGQGTSQFPEEYLHSVNNKHRYSIVHKQDREVMVRWSFMEVLTSILKPVRLCVNTSYRKHIFDKLKEGKTPRLKEMLNISRFVQMNNVSPGASEELDHAFIKLITETQMFRQFVARYIRLNKRNVFDAWCALKNRTIMQQYMLWKSTGVGERFGCLQKLAKGDDGVHTRGGFFGKFKGHKWKKRAFHIKKPMQLDHLLSCAIEIILESPEEKEKKEVGEDDGDEEFEASGSDFDDFDGDDTDDELGDGIVKEEKSKEDDEERARLEAKAHRIGLEEAMKKVNKIKNCFQSATKGIGKDELVLNWYDVEKDLKFRYLTEYVEALKAFLNLPKRNCELIGYNPLDEGADAFDRMT